MLFMGSKPILSSFSYITYFATIIHFSRPSVKTQDDSTFRQTNNLLKTILMIFMVTVFVIHSLKGWFVCVLKCVLYIFFTLG